VLAAAVLPAGVLPAGVLPAAVLPAASPQILITCRSKRIASPKNGRWAGGRPAHCAVGVLLWNGTLDHGSW
jgi:hypothetical protein